MSNEMTKEQTKDYIAALLRERAGHEQYGRADQLAMVDAELDRVGHKGKAPAERATKMTPKPRAEG